MFRPILSALLLGLLAGPVLACPLDLPENTVRVAGHELLVEVAATNASRTCGLSNRWSLPENQGMLFVHKAPRILTYWMKNTHVPLSVAFLDATGRIINIEHMAPDRKDKLYSSAVEAKYALEVNQGWFEAHGVKPGALVEIHLPPVLLVE